MYRKRNINVFKKNNKLRQEISLDEPLNVDYDGNELLLSDIIGTDSDIVQDEIEYNDQKRKVLLCIRSFE